MKRIIDIVLATILFAISFPFFIALSFLLAFANQGQPFFFQVRPGKKGILFKIIKFKTMSDRKDDEGNLLPDSQRITLIGKFIRSSSLDEIPQLLNVIKGDMSLVGPRPLLPEYLPLYSSEQQRRHDVKPGITGWAQVNGRNTVGWQQKFEYDVWYVDHVNFLLDLKIIGLTIKKVMISEGVSSTTSATMERFKGN